MQTRLDGQRGDKPGGQMVAGSSRSVSREPPFHIISYQHTL